MGECLGALLQGDETMKVAGVIVSETRIVVFSGMAAGLVKVFIPVGLVDGRSQNRSREKVR